MTIVIILIIIIVLFLVMGFYLAHYSMTIRKNSLEEIKGRQEAIEDLSWYENARKESYAVQSYDGYSMYAERIYNPSGNGKYIIISHGHTENRFGALKYMKMYLDLGFQIVFYDLRGHGDNAPAFCTFSVRESQDLLAVIRDTRERFSDVEILGIHGESLGGATTIAVLKYKPEVNFAVDDCGFSEIIPVMQAGLKNMHIPTVMVYPASLCAKIRYGYFFQQMRPIDSLRGNEIPVLFIHGQEDTYISCEHAARMQKADPGYNEIHLVPGAEHARSVLTAPADYRGYVETFLKNIGVLSGTAGKSL